MRWMVLAVVVLPSCGGRTSDRSAETEGVACADEFCGSGIPCVVCSPGQRPFCADRPADAPDFWVPALECAHPDADPILTLYCDDATDCAPLTCLWWGLEAMCAERPGAAPCGPGTTWFPTCTSDADCPECAPRCGEVPEGLVARRCE